MRGRYLPTPHGLLNRPHLLTPTGRETGKWTLGCGISDDEERLVPTDGHGGQVTLNGMIILWLIIASFLIGVAGIIVPGYIQVELDRTVDAGRRRFG